MYSGTGTAAFDWMQYAQGDFSFSVIMDCEHRANVSIVSAFCRANGIPLYLSGPDHTPGCPDSGVSGIASHLTGNRHDVIECLSWANAATNLAVLTAKPTGPLLVFTPHSQPLWTIGDEGRYFMVPAVFSGMVNASDAVFVSTDAERALPAFSGVGKSTIHHTPLGVDTVRFATTGSNQQDVFTCVCDCNEPRKRVDLLISAFSRAVHGNSKLRLLLAGKNSNVTPIAPEVEPYVTRLGYVSRDRLTRLYQESGLMVLLSDYEAFGLPVAEALCCGSRVLLNSHDVMLELFGNLPGVHWTTNVDIEGTAERMLEIAQLAADPMRIAEAASARFAWSNTYGRKRDIILNLLDRPATHRSSRPASIVLY